MIIRRFHTQEKPDSQDGFTIVELMIASLVFSTILVVITVGVMRFTDSYYRGINTSNTQTTAQNAIDTITQSIQFSSGGTSPGGAGFFCAGNKVFTYSNGHQFGGTPSPSDRGLYAMDEVGATCGDPSDTDFTNAVNGNTGVELLGKGMRVIQASVTSPDDKLLSSVHLKIAYGDSDLLCNSALHAAAHGCDAGAASYAALDDVFERPGTTDNIQCKLTIGSQFCAVVDLTNVAQQRIE